MAAPGTVSEMTAPDGGWGWLVVIGSFMLQGITVGITYTFGILYVELLDDFKESESLTAWIGSIQAFLMYSTGMYVRFNICRNGNIDDGVHFLRVCPEYESCHIVLYMSLLKTPV